MRVDEHPRPLSLPHGSQSSGSSSSDDDLPGKANTWNKVLDLCFHHAAARHKAQKQPLLPRPVAGAGQALTTPHRPRSSFRGGIRRAGDDSVAHSAGPPAANGGHRPASLPKDALSEHTASRTKGDAAYETAIQDKAKRIDDQSPTECEDVLRDA